ncbi:hypothetical protein J7I93_16045 [Bacillus sp. ISL-47]|uniref:hypothetical protein n=1 Tax=Bacillus sp. ISL-47 TaxID=2819130 RepID=UPI001BE655B2|nr:hypothetical protein [Bacillus sp. ISL-47]MBT2689700.1 hypothetical protein [Bacillus sp. ISL-47]MBT2710783.1 hypothetical protein [Pseudomonas sp. ISL-84]
MADLKQELKQAMNDSWPEESVFTEEEKQRIRNRIGSRAVKSKKKRTDYFPKALTAAAVAGFVILNCGIAGNQTGFFNQQNPDQIVSEEKPFYPGMAYGDMLNGWELQQIETNSNGHSIAVFAGKAEVAGTLDFQKDNVFLLPDQASLEKLPLMDGKNPIISFNEEDQQMLKKVFGIASAVKVEDVKLIINEYRARESLVHQANVLEVIPKEPEITRTAFHLFRKDGKDLVLTEPLNHVYKEFSMRKEDIILSGLSPAEVFQLYLFTEEVEDYFTQYALFNHDPEVEKTFGTLNDYLHAINESPSLAEEQTLLYKAKNAPLEEVIIDDSSAYISISKEEGLGFGLSKNKEGIWKVNWMPTQ